MKLLSCEENALKLSMHAEGRLDRVGRLALAFHLAMCKACRIYSHQIRALDALLRRATRKAMGERPLHLGDAARERLRRRLEDETRS